MIPKDQNGLVLDDYLGAVADVRSRFQLEIPKFGLREMKSSVGVKESVERIVARVIRRHGTAIATKSHPLLADLRESIYSDQVVTPANSGYRILPECRRAVLQRTLEVGLQTITQLPSRYPVVPSPRKQLKSAATAFVKAADLAVAAIGQQEIRSWIALYFEEDDEGRRKLLRGFDEVRWYAETLEKIAKLKVKKLSSDGPNPQVGLALYVANWFEASAGGKLYADLTTLLEAAFHVAEVSKPRWVERLAVELAGPITVRLRSPADGA